MKVPRATASDKDWQSEEDMRTLLRACEIRKDKARYGAAKKKAKAKLEEMKALVSEEKYARAS